VDIITIATTSTESFSVANNMTAMTATAKTMAISKLIKTYNFLSVKTPRQGNFLNPVIPFKNFFVKQLCFLDEGGKVQKIIELFSLLNCAIIFFEN
jgi:hypothetical protein